MLFLLPLETDKNHIKKKKQLNFLLPCGRKKILQMTANGTMF